MTEKKSSAGNGKELSKPSAPTIPSREENRDKTEKVLDVLSRVLEGQSRNLRLMLEAIKNKETPDGLGALLTQLAGRESRSIASTLSNVQDILLYEERHKADHRARASWMRDPENKRIAERLKEEAEFGSVGTAMHPSMSSRQDLEREIKREKRRAYEDKLRTTIENSLKDEEGDSD